MPAITTSFIFPSFINKVFTQTIDVNTGGTPDTFIALLVGTGANVAASGIDEADQLTDITTLDETSGGGYLRQTLTSLAIVVNLDTGKVGLDAANPTFTNVTDANLAGTIIFDDTDAQDQPCVYLDFGTLQNVSGVDVTVVFHADGFLSIQGMGVGN